MNVPAQLAFGLLDRLGVQGRPDLLDITARIGLRVREVDAEGFDGTLVRALNGSKGIIGVKRSIRENSRKRFTIAHEIGHFVIPSHRSLENVCTSDLIESWRTGLGTPEMQANEFAVELLLPERVVRGPLRLNTPSLHTISEVAGEFETSLTATALRFVDLTDSHCVVVWTEGKSVKWYRRSESFPLYLPKDTLPCDGSFALKLCEGGLAPNDLAEVRPESWLDRRDISSIERVLEHSIRLPSYNAVLTLLWFQLADVQSEEESAFLEELDPEDFTLRRRRWPD